LSKDGEGSGENLNLPQNYMIWPKLIQLYDLNALLTMKIKIEIEKNGKI
jgi:hypothetical protein